MDWLLLIYGIIAAVILYGLTCFIQALRTPPDAWTETNRACGFPRKRRK